MRRHGYDLWLTSDENGWRSSRTPTFAAMLVHLGTVHLPLYLGALRVLITTGWALVERRSGSAIAFGGALLSMAAEAWHAVIHLRPSTRGGPIAEGVAVIRFVVVVTAVWAGGRQERRLMSPSARPRAVALNIRAVAFPACTAPARLT